MARVLVSLDLTKGLIDSIIIQKDPAIFYKAVNYKWISFKCGRCHEYGHLVKDCALKLSPRNFRFRRPLHLQRTQLHFNKKIILQNAFKLFLKRIIRHQITQQRSSLSNTARPPFLGLPQQRDTTTISRNNFSPPPSPIVRSGQMLIGT